MMYSYRIEQAIRAAAVLHQGQARKGSAPYPYVAHPFAVSCILADYTDDEDIIISGLLHDTLEDTDYTPSELTADFGSRVCAIVEAISEHVDSDDPRPRSERKRGYIHSLEKGGEESLIVAAADKIHNLRSIVEEYQDNFDAYLSDFSGTLGERLHFYETISAILNNRLENAIIHEFNHVFAQFKTFIETNR